MGIENPPPPPGLDADALETDVPAPAPPDPVALIRSLICFGVGIKTSFLAAAIVEAETIPAAGGGACFATRYKRPAAMRIALTGQSPPLLRLILARRRDRRRHRVADF